jgi:hypothetical protein
LDTAAGQIAVRGELNVSVGQHVGIELRQHLCFSAQGDLVTAEYD